MPSTDLLDRLPPGFTPAATLVVRPREVVVRGVLEGREVVLRASEFEAPGALAEFQVLRGLDVPGIPRFVGAGVLDGGGLWVAREWVEGEDLGALVRRGALDGAGLRRVLADVVAAFAALHAAGHVHGDPSPSNIVVDAKGRGHVLDFGLAAAAGRSPMVQGTPPYIAPEVLRGAPPTPESDLFGLGALLAVLLSGDAAFDVRAFYGRFPAQPFLEAAGIDADALPEWSRATVAALVARDPRERPSDAYGLAIALGWKGDADDAAPAAVDRLVDPLWGRRDALVAAALGGESARAWIVVADDDEALDVASALAVEAATRGAAAASLTLSKSASAARTTLDLDRALESLLEGLSRRTAPAEGAPTVLVAVDAHDPWALNVLDALGRLADGHGAPRCVAVSGAAARAAAQRRTSPWFQSTEVRAGRFDPTPLRAALHLEEGGEESAALDALLERIDGASGGSSRRARALLERAAKAGAFVRRAGAVRPSATFAPESLATGERAERLPALGAAARAALLRLVSAQRALPRAWFADAALGELERHGLVELRAGAARALHPGLAPSDVEPDRAARAAAHAALAESLASLGEAPELGWAHALFAGERGLAVVRGDVERYLERGLDARIASGLGRAVALLGREERPLPPALRSALVEALGRAGESSAAARAAKGFADPRLDALARALDAARRGDRTAAAAAFTAAGDERSARLEAVHAALDAGDVDGALALLGALEPALEALRAGGAFDARRAAADLLGLRAHALRRAGREDEAIDALHRAIDALDGPGGDRSPLLPALLVNRASLVRWRGGAALTDALEDLERALALYADLGMNTGLAQVQSLLGAVQRELGDLVRAEESLADALGRRSRMPDAVARELARGSLGLVRLERGHLGRALDDLARARAALEEAGHRAALPRVDAAIAEARARLTGERFAAGPGAADSGAADAALAGLLGSSPPPRAADLLERASADALQGRDRLAARAAMAAFALALEERDAARADLARRIGERALASVLEGLSGAEREGALRTLLRADDPRPDDLGRWLDDTEDDMDVERILKLNESLVREDDTATLLSAITRAALVVSGAERGFIVIERDGQLMLDTAFDTVLGEVTDDEVAWSRTVVEEALALGAPLRLADAVDSVDWGEMRSIESIGLRSVLAAPFVVDDAVRGVIVVDDVERPGAFGPREERLLGLLAGQAALALRQVQRLEAIRDLSRQLKERVVLQSSTLGEARRALVEVSASRTPIEGMVGDSKPMDAVRNLLGRVAPAEIAVLVEGESGTGKEVAARAVHGLSARSAGPFVSENCAALPASLVEAELFGAKKGAFTGADHDRTGLFERAEGGTLFLDEIGELPIEAQAKLLRVLETRRVRRVGDEVERPVDFRLVSATNRDLGKEADEGRFRSDLLFRIDGVRVRMPSLAERPEDIPALVEHFLALEAARADRPLDIAPEVVRRLEARAWPGNVRELANEVRRLVILSGGPIVDPDLVREARVGLEPSGPRALRTIAELEREAIVDALERFEGDKRRVADALGISRAKVYQRLKEWGLT